MLKSSRKLAITPGEPGGIGPDIILTLAAAVDTSDWLVIADPELLRARAERLGLDISLREHAEIPAQPAPSGTLDVLSVSGCNTTEPGQLDVRNAPYVLSCLDRATDACLSGELAGLVTGPVQKSIINDAGIDFSGHTEYLQTRCGVPQVVMMLATPRLRVALVTTHLPLREVAAAINRPRLERVLRIVDHDLRRHFGIDRPQIGICGLNPHAGEGGHLGTEEIEIIEPVLARLRAEGMHLSGPAPADTLFTPPALAPLDAVVAMYHDQGLPVLKHSGFGEAVNITLGLPMIRTSVDHGTALALAGTGAANCGSLRAALAVARQMAMARSQKGDT